MYHGVETLRACNALITGNRLLKAEAEKKLDLTSHLATNYAVELEHFGLFDTSSPNFNTFYPGLTSEDLEPKDEDFVYPVYRALSKTRVRPSAPVSFMEGNALKDSMALLVGQSVFANHEAITGDELGVICKAEWQEAKLVKLASGEDFTIPAGINVTLKLDGKSNPKIARGVMMTPPSIHSVSVTLEFSWQKSHPGYSDDEFFSRLGNYNEKGELVERVVDKIIKYSEISLVPHGADVFAQRVDESGNIVNPEFSKVSYSFSDTSKITHTLTSGDTLGYKQLADISLSNTKAFNKPKPTPMNKTLLAGLMLSLGLTFPTEGLSDDQILQKLTEEATLALTAKQTSLDLANSSISTTTTELQSAKDRLTAAEASVAIMLGDLRTEAVRLATLAMDNQLDAGIQQIIMSSSVDGTKAFITQYSKLVNDKFSGNGSVHHPDGSTLGLDGRLPKTPDTGTIAESLAEIAKTKTKITASSIHSTAFNQK